MARKSFTERKQGDKYVVEVSARVNGKRRFKSQRFDLVSRKVDRRAWAASAKAELEAASLAGVYETPTRRTFAQEADLYLESIKGEPKVTTATQYIREWCQVFGDRYRADITPVDLLTQKTRLLMESRPKHGPAWLWKDEPLSPQSVKKRFSVLRNMFTVLEGTPRHIVSDFCSSPNGAFEKAEEEPRGLSPEILSALFAHPKMNRTAAYWIRLRLLYLLGIGHKLLQHLTREDVNFEDGTVYLVPRLKGKEVERRSLRKEIPSEAIALLKEFDERNLWGYYQPTGMYKPLKIVASALLRERDAQGLETLEEDRKILRTMTPYVMRHSYGTHLSVATGDDIGTVQLALNHSNPQQTRRYIKGREKAILRNANSKFMDFLEGKGDHSRQPLTGSEYLCKV